MRLQNLKMTNFLAPFIALAASAALSFSSSPGIVSLGDQFNVTINATSGGRGTVGTDAVVLYDPRMLQVVKVIPGEIYPNYPEPLQDIDNVHGKTSFSGTVSFNPPRVIGGTFGQVVFEAKKVGKTQIAFDWRPGGTADSNIVPYDGELDILTEAPRGMEVSIKESSTLERLFFFIKSVFAIF